jgi:RHS repeat-associated protein
MFKGLRGTSPGLAVHGYVLVLFISLAAATADPGNRALPQTNPQEASLEFSGSPTTEEIFRARVFEEPLVPIGGEPTPAENAALAAALRGYAQRNGPDDFSSLTAFLEKYPNSPWAAALLTDLGLEYYNTAHYSLALEAWKEAWLLAKDAAGAKSKAVGDRAAGELAYVYARLGRMTELEALLNSVAGRVFVGTATEKIGGAREGLWTMQHRPEIAFRCGPFALERIKRVVDPQHPATEIIHESVSTQKGCSLFQVAELSQKIGLNYQMAFRQKGGAFVVPSVVHWKVGHYAALVRQEGERYLVEDPTFGNRVWATRQALEAETSGYFLIPPEPLPKGWRTVESKEGEGIWGKGSTSSNDPGPNGPCNKQSGGSNPCESPCESASGGGGGGGGAGGPPPLVPGQGLAVSSVHFSTVNLNLRDQPVGYSPPVGPPVRFWVRYNHRDAFQPTTFTYANFGSKWTCDWISYITDNPQSPLADVNYYIRGGGTRTFTGFDTNAQTYAFQQYDQTQLTRTGPASYEMLWPDGSKLVFGQSDGSIGTSRNVFLTQVVDPFGNAVTLTYDGSLRLVAITDAIGQVTTVTYGNTNDIYKITQVTDPFGRSASFSYDALDRLTNITDVIGLTSQFTYETNGDFINSLITPYGTNTFIRGDNGNTRALDTIYADGSRDRVEFNQSTSIPGSEPQSTVPTGMATQNGLMVFRNTFYWSRSACATSYGDYTKARIYHWLHAEDETFASGILESTKEPLENRVWYDYVGQIAANVVGTSDRPSHVGRVLDDGSTQLYTYAYNGFGHVTNSIDPVGRTLSFVYDTNGIDLLEVRQTRAGNNELLSRMTYNTQHLPLTSTDAAGQTTTYAYNAQGQVLTATDPKNETTTYTYDTNGYLVAVVGPLPGTNDVVTATYDSYGRLRTKTDVSGYTLTFDYDALDRITRMTHPDSTFEQFTYDRLDPVVVQDRAGRQTLLEHDPLGQLTKRTDPLGRLTLFQWCSCGDIKTLTDPLGQTTTWHKDVQGRLTSKVYGDGSQKTYLYENTTSRLRQVIDEKQQTTTFVYNPDGTVSWIGYANDTVATPVVTFTYDPNYERRTSMTDGTGTTLYSYNPITASPALGAGQLASIVGPLPNVTITYAYDELGRRVQTAINGVASALTFDAAGRVIGETNALGSFTYAYDGSSSRLVSETFPNGQTASQGYGNLLQDLTLQRITYQVGTAPISEFLYDRDIARRRIRTWSQQAGAQPPNAYTFGYDNADQLLSGTVTNSEALVNTFAYGYDLAGNRLSEQTGVATNTATYNALNQTSTTASRSGASRTNEWDGEDRLTAVNAGNQRTEFNYDGLGRLAGIRLLTNGIQASWRQFVWCDNQICQERDVTGAVTKRFFAQGVKLETGVSAGSYYYTRDHLGSIRELTDGSGNVRVRYAYDPVGRRTQLTGDVEADFGFAGMFWSSEAGLAIARFRAYDPGLGRWLSRDPLRKAEEKEGPNLYAYVANNPVNAVDPLGLKTGCCSDAKYWLDQIRSGCGRIEQRAAGRCSLAFKYTPEIALVECAKAAADAQAKCLELADYETDAAREYLDCLVKNNCDPCAAGAPGAPGGPPNPWVGNSGNSPTPYIPSYVNEVFVTSL